MPRLVDPSSTFRSQSAIWVRESDTRMHMIAYTDAHITNVCITYGCITYGL